MTTTKNLKVFIEVIFNGVIENKHTILKFLENIFPYQINIRSCHSEKTNI